MHDKRRSPPFASQSARLGYPAEPWGRGDTDLGEARARSPDSFLRFDAAHALGELGRTDALPTLRELAGDPAMPRADSRSTAWSVGDNARRAIAKIEARQRN